jgi:nucleoid-associated protein EbfC
MSIDVDTLDPDDLIAEVEQLKTRLEEAQQEIQETELSGFGADGMVTVTLKGMGVVTAVVIHPDAVREYDAYQLGDVVLEALNDGFRKSAELFRDRMGPIFPEGTFSDEALSGIPGVTRD